MGNNGSKQINLNSLLILIVGVLVSIVGFFVTELITKVNKTNDLTVEMRTNFQIVSGDVKELKKLNASQDHRIDTLESSVTDHERRLGKVESKVGL